MINIPKVDIYIPSFGRADKLPHVIENVFNNTPSELFFLYIIAEENDSPTQAVAKAMGVEVIINSGSPCYADCINTAYHQTKEPYFFTGADDLDFKENWLQRALEMFSVHRHIGVVGTNDLGSIPIGPQRDATHYLVSRNYIQKHSGRMDAKDTVLYPYRHNYTDKEFIETAKKRHAYSYCPDSVVEHLHWAWNKSQMDETYRKGFNSNKEDELLYRDRQHLWA